MRKEFQSFLHSCIALMLEPVVEFCLSRGIHIQEFTELSKAAFVRAAERKLKREGREVSVSKLSVMSGVQRPEVNRLRGDGVEMRAKNFITRVVGQWQDDKRFLDRRRRPKRLSTEGTKSQFAKLVSAVSTDLNPHTVRFEMERLGLIEQRGGFVHLLQPANITAGDPLKTLRFIGEDCSDIVAAVEENAFSAHAVPNLHARTQYDNVPDAALPEIRNWFVALGERMHREARHFLSKFDRDLNPKAERGGDQNRVILGTFSRIEALDPTQAKPRGKK